MNNKNSNSNSNSNVTNLSSSSSSRPSSSTTTATATTTTTTQACASCKYQRRKCNPDCDLAPYFPADHQRQFLNAHRLFGVSNILKIIRGLDPHHRSEAMKSIIFQSNARANDPIGGCYRIIVDLERQLEHDCAELALIYHQLALYQAQAGAHQTPHENLIDNDVAVAVAAAAAAATDDDAALYGNNLMLQQQQQQQQQQYFDYFYFDSGGGGGDTNENIGENNIENNNNNNNNNNAIINSNISISSGSVNNDNVIIGVNNNGMNEVVGPVEDVKPLVDMFDMTHALAIGEEEDDAAVEAAATTAGESSHNKAAAGSYQYCSTEVQSKEPNPMEHVQEHDLKGAASLFTLTSRNSSYV